MKKLNKAVVWILSLAIKAYRLVLSPMMGRDCRFQPTCSVYALEALERHGAWCGSILAAKRILSCHPWGGSGYHPVPDSDICKHVKK
jgi:putative membrane protein insertion efficiency factor